MELSSGEYLVVFASGKNRDVAGQELHTNFNLSSSGEYLALIAPDGTTVASEFAPTYGQQVPDVAYGRDPATGALLFYPTPTPNAPNTGGQATVPFELLITEFMAANHGTLADQDGDFADWIEIYNAGSTSVDLDGWYLTDNDWLTNWKFPRVTLPAGEYLTVFASANDLRDRDEELHTNFRLSASGGYLALVKPDGVTVVSEFEYGDQQTDVSYGLTSDFRNQRFFDTPTPGMPNTEEFLAVSFSHPHGFYNQAIALSLGTETAQAEIRYTTDGSEPTATTGTVYSGPLTIDATTTIRAAAFLPDEAPTIFTRTYLFLDDILSQSGDGLPTTWGFFTDYEMDPEVVTDPNYQDLLSESLLGLPAISIVTEMSGLFGITTGIYSNPMMEGEEWTRAASFEWIDPTGRPGVHANVGLAVEHSVGELGPPQTPKLPFRLTFNSSSGQDPIRFPDDQGDWRGLIDGLVLHAGYEDSWLHPDGTLRQQAIYVRDSFLRESQAAMGQPALASQLAHVFINGLYWGVYDAVEAPTALAVAEHLGGTPAQFDVIDGTGVQAGNDAAWQELLAEVNGDVADPLVYERIQQLVDVDNLADFVILNTYTGNTSALDQGWYAARNREREGGFVFFVWDGEATLRDSCCQAPDDMLTPSPQHLVNRLLQNDEFARLFGDRAQQHLFAGGALDPEVAAARFAAYDLETLLIGEAARWGDYRRDGHAFDTGPFELMT
ncbi:MAG: lamin tail domain-containing protein, partial [Planctomycetales bacterium]|nr:lamin tail domain-containing protein [Planctomycetales bacterium]